MSTPISYSSMNTSQERLSYFKEKHDAYKSLISRIAEQLRPEDMTSLFWYTDTPPDLRGCSALEVLENLQRLGKFSEKTTVQYLSRLMKDIKRIDLMKEVDSYSHNYVRHGSLPAVRMNPTPQTPRSLSFGNHFTHSTPFPYQETGPFLVHPHPSTPLGASRGQAHLASVASGISDNTHITRKPPAVPASAQSYSMEGLADPRQASRTAPPFMHSPGLEPGDRHRMMSSLTDSHSMSNSGSIHFHYNSHPSSCNVSQEAFHSEPPSAFMPYGEMQTNYPATEMQPLEYSNNISRPHSLSFPQPVYPNWYQHASLSSIPQEPESAPYLAGRTFSDPKTPYQHQHVAQSEGPHSQESLAYLYGRRSQQVQPALPHHNYTTPPYSRRAPVVVQGHNNRPSRVRNQSFSGYPVRASASNHNVPVPRQHQASPEMRHREHYVPTGNEQVESSGDEVCVHPSSHHSPKEAAMNFPGTGNDKLAKETKCDVNQLNSKEYAEHVPACDQDKAMAHIQENLVANNFEHVVLRRRANSLHNDSEYSTQKVNNRLSVMSMDERPPRNKPPRGNNNRFSLSVDERHLDGQTMPRSASAISSAVGSATLISGSKGSAIHSCGTVESEDNQSASSLSSSRTTSSHTHRQKGTLFSRLSQQFSRVVKPHKEIEWPIKRNKLNKIIYEQKDKHLTCPFKLELDGGLKGSNPKLTLHIHPYGKEEDANRNITLEVALEIPTQPGSQRLDSRAEVEVNVKAEDAERKVVFGRRTVCESVRFNYFYLKGFVSHQELKQSHSSQVLFTICASLINNVSSQ